MLYQQAESCLLLCFMCGLVDRLEALFLVVLKFILFDSLLPKFLQELGLVGSNKEPGTQSPSPMWMTGIQAM